MYGPTQESLSTSLIVIGYVCVIIGASGGKKLVVLQFFLHQTCALIALLHLFDIGVEFSSSI